MQTTRGTSLSDEGDERLREEPSANGKRSDEGDERLREEPSANGKRGDAGDAGGRPARRRVGVLLVVAALVVVLDVISKIIVVAKLTDRAPVRLLGGLLKLEETRNPGAAFSIGTGSTVLFAVVAIAVIAVILRTATRLFSAAWAVVLGLLLGGATGNLIDRLVRSPGAFRGWVVDWIQLPHFAVFNLADSAITIGGVLAVLLAVQGRQLDGTVHRGVSGGGGGATTGDAGEANS